MDPWSLYQSRSDVRGVSRRDSMLHRTNDRLTRQIPSILSYHIVFIEGEKRDIAIINSDNLDTKTICTLPGEDVKHGGIVEWMNQHWIITERDANTEVYTKAIMRQCNHLLKWINKSGEVIERWCIVEDGTRYLTGEFGDNNYVLVRGDSRISITIPKDDETVELDRSSRFIIDDPDTGSPFAYRLTKPFRLGGTYGNDGVYKFVLAECNTEYDDNLELQIADYYKHFPREHIPEDSPTNPTENIADGRGVWL